MSSTVSVSTVGEELRASSGGDQLLGVRSGITLEGQFATNAEQVAFGNYTFQWYCFTPNYGFCNDLQSPNSIELLVINPGMYANLDNRIAIGEYLFYFVVNNTVSGVSDYGLKPL